MKLNLETIGAASDFLSKTLRDPDSVCVEEVDGETYILASWKSLIGDYFAKITHRVTLSYSGSDGNMNMADLVQKAGILSTESDVLNRLLKEEWARSIDIARKHIRMTTPEC